VLAFAVLAAVVLASTAYALSHWREAGGGHAVMAAQWSWECYWVAAIRTHDDAAAAWAHAALNTLLAHNLYEAPAGAPEEWTPSPLPTRPFMVYAHDGGLAWTRAGYRMAAAGDATRIAQSCPRERPWLMVSSRLGAGPWRGWLSALSA
jgi:hypothetical protein